MFAYVILFLLAIHHAEQNENMEGIVTFYYDVVNEVMRLNPRDFVDKWTVASSSSADTDVANNIAEVKKKLDLLETSLKKSAQPPISDCDFALSYSYATTILICFERLRSSVLYSHPSLKKAGCLFHKCYLKWNSLCPRFKGKEEFSLLSLGEYRTGNFLSRVENVLNLITPAYAGLAEKVAGWERVYFYTADKREDISYGQSVGIDNRGKLLTNGRWMSYEFGKEESHDILATCHDRKQGQIRYCDAINLKNIPKNNYAMVVGDYDFSPKYSEVDSAKATWIMLNQTGDIPKLQ